MDDLGGSYLAGPCMALRALGHLPPSPPPLGTPKWSSKRSEWPRELIDSIGVSEDDPFYLTGI